jgi:hypothetical protein
VTYLFIGLVSFFFIGAKAFQQLNVLWKKYTWVPVFSFVMAACEVYIVVSIVEHRNWQTVVALGSGASLGCVLSMWAHPKLTGKGMGHGKSKARRQDIS